LTSNKLRIVKIGLCEIDRLFALGGRGHAGDQHVDLAGLQRGDQRHELHVEEFHRPLEPRTQQPGKLAIVSGDATILVDKTERLTRGRYADFQHLAGCRQAA
jgi:hypothetical protein